MKITMCSFTVLLQQMGPIKESCRSCAHSPIDLPVSGVRHTQQLWMPYKDKALHGQVI